MGKDKKPRRTITTELYEDMRYLSGAADSATHTIVHMHSQDAGTYELTLAVSKFKFPVLVLADDVTLYGLCLKHAYNRGFVETDVGTIDLRRSSSPYIRQFASFMPDLANPSTLYRSLVKLWEVRMAQMRDYVAMISHQHRAVQGALVLARAAARNG